MKSAEDGQVDIIETLLDAGADIEACNRKGRTPLSFAAAPSMGRPTKVGALKLLLRKGADVNHEDLNGNTPKDHASHENRWEALKAFAEFE